MNQRTYNHTCTNTHIWLSHHDGLSCLSHARTHRERHKKHTYIKHISERRVDRRKEEVKSTTCLILIRRSVCPSFKIIIQNAYRLMSSCESMQSERHHLSNHHLSKSCVKAPFHRHLSSIEQSSKLLTLHA